MSAIISKQSLGIVATPIVTQVIKGLYEQRANEWKAFMEEKEGDKYEFHQIVTLHGFGSAPMRSEGESFAFDQAGLSYSTQIPYALYGLGFGMTQESIDDTRLNVDTMAVFGEHLAQSIIETEEINAANLLNNGFNSRFTQTGGDGQPLFSANHPSFGGAPSVSNIAVTPSILSQTSLEQMLIQNGKQKDARGKFIRLTPKNLVVPPELGFQAQVILESVLRSDTTNNAKNVLNGYFTEGRKIVTRLTSPTAWFINNQGFRDTGVMRLKRGDVKVTKEGDFMTDVMRVKAGVRQGYGWGDFRCIMGNSGV